jgi:FixJ family two-component response regulator
MAPRLRETALAATLRDKVYIVDDAADVRKSARALLEAYDLAVEEFDSARAFLESVNTDCKACLLLDLNMPEMGGLERLERLHQLAIALPVIIVTAQDDADVAERARRAGAFDFFQKPVDASLIAAVGRALKAA